jgi:uncharacterized protein (DUF362 family)
MPVLLIDEKNPFTAFQRTLAAFPGAIDPARGVLIKPNIVFASRPSSGEITPPALTRALVLALRERYPAIEIILGEGVAAGCDPQENFRVSGYDDLARELQVPLVDLNHAEHVSVAWKFGRLELPRLALERSYINLPILKPSSACVISGAMKNQKGLLLPGMKKHFHRMGLHEQIAELNRVVRPALTILDGGRFFGPGRLVCGDNCGEIDALACEMLGIQPPEHVRLAQAAGIYAPGFAVTGARFAPNGAASHLAAREYKHIGRLRLWSNPSACTGCRYIFRDIKQNLLKPRNALTAAKLLTYALSGAEIVMGSSPSWRKEHRTVICIGACTRRVAQEGGYIHVPGCPPTLQDLLDHLH